VAVNETCIPSRVPVPCPPLAPAASFHNVQQAGPAGGGALRGKQCQGSPRWRL